MGDKELHVQSLAEYFVQSIYLINNSYYNYYLYNMLSEYVVEEWAFLQPELKKALAKICNIYLLSP